MKVLWILIGVAGLYLSNFAFAQSSGGDFEITSFTIDNGGGQSSGGDFVLTGTIGQHDASSTLSTGADFLLAPGFWARVIDRIFADGFE